MEKSFSFTGISSAFTSSFSSIFGRLSYSYKSKINLHFKVSFREGINWMNDSGRTFPYFDKNDFLS